MSISYKILWIDDQIDEPLYQNAREEFNVYIKALGFEPFIKCFEDGSKLHELIKSDKFDLILFDYRISDDTGNGDSLIKIIREGKIYTEVLFYSAQSNFEEIAKKLFSDRISFFNLEGDERLRGFSEKVKLTIDLTLLKLQEVTNMRGIVMSETSELDNIIEEILHNFIIIDNDDSKKLFDYIIKIISDSAKDNFSDSEKLKGKGHSTIVKERIFDADKKSRAINRLLEILKINDKEPYIDFYKKYRKSVLEIRNILAHAKCITRDGIDHILISGKDGEKLQEFNHEMCLKIRQDLIYFNTSLNSLKRQLESQK